MKRAELRSLLPHVAASVAFVGLLVGVTLSTRSAPLASPRPAAQPSEARVPPPVHFSQESVSSAEGLDAQSLERLAAAKAEANWSEALCWAAELPNGPQRTQAVVGALRALGERCPEEVLEFTCTELPRSTERDAFQVWVLQSWTARDAAAALDWTLRRAPADLVPQTLETLLLAWNGRDPSAAVRWVNAHAALFQRRSG